MSPDQFRKHVQSQTKAGAVVGGVFGLVFLGIGITVIVSVWAASGFGAPPLVFRIFASLIAIAFVAMGGTVAYGAFRTFRGDFGPSGFVSGRAQSSDTIDSPPYPPDELGSRVSYTCPACGAPLSRGADVSPHGDVKCTHCGGWFNVHKRNS
jgi:DNA-directed RNA polymerase subunit RPC12/RpoP